MRHMALPILTLTMVTMPKYFRTAKSSVLQVMNEDFITTLRATGTVVLDRLDAPVDEAGRLAVVTDGMALLFR